MRALDWETTSFDNFIVAIHEAPTLAEMPELGPNLIRTPDEKWANDDNGNPVEPEINGYVRLLLSDEPHGGIAIFPPIVPQTEFRDNNLE